MSVTEPTLFEMPATAAVRHSDPETSKVAYLQLKVRDRQAQVLTAMRRRVVPSTAEEIRSQLASTGIRQERNEVASRLAELADGERWPDRVPLVRRVGVRKNHRQRPVGTWVLTGRGREVAQELEE